jgi:hypothetical protein
MSDHVRLILAFRAAGLLLIGVALPGLAAQLARALQNQELLTLRDGHPDAVLGIAWTILAAALAGPGWQGFLALGFFAAGIGMVAAPCDRIRSIIRFLGRP